MKKFLVIAALLIPTLVSAQDITPFMANSLNDGVVYYLPKTAIDIEVTATKISYAPGDLCQYASRYLRLNNVSAQADVHWEIKEVKVSSVGVPDPDNAYMVKVKDKDVASNVQLSKEGIILAINTKVNIEESTDKKVETPAPKKLDPHKFLTEDILSATSTAKMADLVAKEIYSIRESKNSLIKGQSEYMPKDGAAMKLMLDNLEEQEQALTQMFAGTTTNEEHTLHFYIAPEDQMKDQVAFRFSRRLGIVKADDLSGAPVYISMESVDPIPAIDPKAAEKKKKMEGIIYNIPGKARVTVASTEKQYFKGELPVTQFGSTEVLVNDLFKSKINTRVIFHPQTGAIQKIDKD